MKRISKAAKEFLSAQNKLKLNEEHKGNQNNVICSPEERNIKLRSDKAYKSSLTSSTTTHTNNVRDK